MKLIGLTGGIASGKSTVSRVFQNLDIPVIDADQIAREVVQPSSRTYRAVVKYFGPEILQPDRTLDRTKLGNIIFSDPSKRRALNRLTHPAIRWEMLKRVVELWASGEKMVVIDAPLLYEAGLDKFMGVVVVVYVSQKLQLARLLSREKTLSESAALARIKAQTPLSDKATRADYVIDNSGELSETERQVREIARKLTPGWGKWMIEWVGVPVLLAILVGAFISWKRWETGKLGVLDPSTNV